MKRQSSRLDSASVFRVLTMQLVLSETGRSTVHRKGDPGGEWGCKAMGHELTGLAGQSRGEVRQATGCGLASEGRRKAARDSDAAGSAHCPGQRDAWWGG